MPDIQDITWKQLTGNKFIVGFHPSMLSDDGYRKQQRIRITGQDFKSMFNVIYDREYVIERIIRFVCKPLFCLGKQRIIQLIETAWDIAYPNSTDKAVTVINN